jgi:hypothetical protein
VPDLIQAVVWYDSLATDSGTWVAGLSFAQIDADTVVAGLRQTPPFTVTRKLIQAHECREIAGLDLTSEP